MVVQVSTSKHWAPEERHDSEVTVVGADVVVIDSHRPNGGVQLMPEQQSPKWRKVDMSMHWAPEARHDSGVIVVGLVVVIIVGSQWPNGKVFPRLQLRPEQQMSQVST